MMAFSLSAANTKSILLDIEGTTTPIAFVYEVLFPFARRFLRDYLMTHIGSAELEVILTKLREDQDLVPPPSLSASRHDQLDSLIAHVESLMDRDSKSSALKSLQGKIWEQGYRNGTLRSQVYADVPPALERWHQSGRQIAIFSSGSVLAQKLLFEHTVEGDLTKFVNHYFDTTTGPKTFAQSYYEIARALQLPPRAILFISDVVRELDAALESGMNTLLCIRPGNHPQPSTHQHSTIQSFDEILE